MAYSFALFFVFVTESSEFCYSLRTSLYPGKDDQRGTMSNLGADARDGNPPYSFRLVQI